MQKPTSWVCYSCTYLIITPLLMKFYLFSPKKKMQGLVNNNIEVKGCERKSVINKRSWR